MPNIFVISAATESTKLDASGRGEITFTASNRSGRPQRAFARLVALAAAKHEWLALGGEVERDFPIEGTHQFVAKITTPPGTSAGRYTFRLDVVDAKNPDENYSQGPTVAFEVAPNGVKPPPKFPWWILAVVAGVLVLGVLLYLRFRTKYEEVPSVVGKTVAEAKKSLEEKSFQVTTTNRPDAIAPAGQVVAQEPAPRTRAKTKSTVNLGVASPPPDVEVPNVTRLPFDSAVTKLEEKGFKIQKAGPERSLDFQPNQVMKQSPEAFVTAKAGSVVTLTVAGRSVKVPEVRGLRLDIAGAKMNEVGLRFAIAGDQLEGAVVKTDPAANSVVLADSEVVTIQMPGPPILIPPWQVKLLEQQNPGVFLKVITPHP